MASIAPPAHTRRDGVTTDDWITPKWLIDRFGPFDLDPCASLTQPWPCAAKQYTVNDNGLIRPWVGSVWLNPPYGRRTSEWLRTLAHHGDGVALVFARTETKMFFESVWPLATSLLFIRDRLTFCFPDGSKAPHNSGGPSVLVAYGDAADSRLKDASDCGAYAKTTYQKPS